VVGYFWQIHSKGWRIQPSDNLHNIAHVNILNLSQQFHIGVALLFVKPANKFLRSLMSEEKYSVTGVYMLYIYECYIYD